MFLGINFRKADTSDFIEATYIGEKRRNWHLLESANKKKYINKNYEKICNE